MKQVIELIVEERARYIERHHRAPARVKLGHDLHDILLREVEPLLTMLDGRMTDEPTVYGMKIEVDYGDAATLECIE